MMGRETGSTWGRCSCGFPPPLSGPGQGLLTGRPPGEGPVAATWWCGGHRQVVPSLHSRSRQPPSTGSLRGPRLASPACFADPAGAGVRAHVQAPGPRPHPERPRACVTAGRLDPVPAEPGRRDMRSARALRPGCPGPAGGPRRGGQCAEPGIGARAGGGGTRPARARPRGGPGVSRWGCCGSPGPGRSRPR